MSQFNLVRDKAPRLLAEFLDTLLDDCRPMLVPENGEVQIIYIMHPASGDGETTEYIISIVALSGEDKILRVLRTITLSDLLQTLLKQIPDA